MPECTDSERELLNEIAKPDGKSLPIVRDRIAARHADPEVRELWIAGRTMALRGEDMRLRAQRTLEASGIDWSLPAGSALWDELDLAAKERASK